jgi:protein O-mannosyl-transferase
MMAQRQSNQSFPAKAALRAHGYAGAKGPPDFSSAGPDWRRHARVIGMCVALFAVVAWAFLPATRNDFLRFDDTAYVTSNAQVQRGLNWEGVASALRNPVAGNWHPLTVLSHTLDYQLYGLRPWGHHLTNVLLHATNTVLLFLVFWRMTGAFWRCAVLAMLFGLHPLRVESVAWVAERKDVLSGFFFMLTLWAYARYVAGGGWRAAEAGQQTSHIEHRTSNAQRVPPSTCFYLLSLLCFALGLLSKPMLVTVPFVLLLLDYWPLRRLARHPLSTLFLEKLPFFGLAAACSVVVVLAQRTAGALAWDLPLWVRMANTPVSYVRYLGKAFWPMNLTLFYPHPVWWPAWQVLGAVALLVVISTAVLLVGRSRPHLIVGWLWFLGALIPAIGLVQVGNQSMADRYTYVPLIGLLFMLVWAAYDLTSRWRHQTVGLSALAIVCAIGCFALTRRQIAFWKDDETVWRHALAVTGGNDLAHLHLGIALGSGGQLDEAIAHFNEAIRFRPQDPGTHSRLAYALIKKQRLAEAIQEYELALQLSPEDAPLHNDLGLTLARQGRAEEAIAQYNEALRLKPSFVEAHYNLGLSLAKLGRYAEAGAQFEEVVRLDPTQTSARRKLEEMLAQSPNAHYQLGAELAQKGAVEAAAQEFALALELDPAFAAAHHALGIIRQQQHRVPEALNHWREAARLAPQWPDPLNNLAWVLATDPRPEVRDAAAAMKAATRAVELAGTNHVGVLDTLAAAYGQAGRFAEATATAQRAEAAAIAQGQNELAGEIRHRLALYHSHQPFLAPK